MVAKKLLIVTALVETATGLMLLVSPTLVVTPGGRLHCSRTSIHI